MKAQILDQLNRRIFYVKTALKHITTFPRHEIYFTNGQKSVCELFSNFGLKFGRELDLDELNNVIKGTFSISPLSTELFTLENRVKIGIFWVWQLITFEPLGRFVPNFQLPVYQTFLYQSTKFYVNRFRSRGGDLFQPPKSRE